METIRHVAVIGAGAMGSGIAALLVDAGLSVTLLDLDAGVADAVARRIAGRGDGVSASNGIRSGSSLADLALAADADWIIETAAEDLGVKRAIFKAINAVRRPGSIVSSNTSTIRLSQLTASLDPADAPDYLITHFFNPPRVMRLVELIAGPWTRPDAVTEVERLARDALERCVVRCRDTPGFIANRIGNFWSTVAIHEAIALKLDVEEADAILGKPFGLPVGIFTFLDHVGVDLVPAASRSLQSALDPSDPLRAYRAEHPLIMSMVRDGRIGRKSGAGFYRKGADGQWEVLDLQRRVYRPYRPVASAALAAAGQDLRVLMEHDAPGGRFASQVMSRTLAYAASLIPDVAETPEQIDQAMREGYGWARGPFELIADLGGEWFKLHLGAEGVSVPAFLHDR